MNGVSVLFNKNWILFQKTGVYPDGDPRTTMVQQKSILIAEDDPDLLEVISDMLMDEFPEIKIVRAENGADALQKIIRQRFDLLITDIKMPKLDGGKLIEQLAQMRNGERPNDVIVITGGGIEEKTKPQFSGFVWMEKPINRSQFIKTIRDRLKR